MKWNIDNSWTLFLDRDGVINKKLDGDYVKKVDEFKFIEGAKEAIHFFSSLFKRVVVVTNQQGIGKGIMTHENLQRVHDHMKKELDKLGVKIDAIYYCPNLAAENAPCRKPNIGMAENAKKDFPEIDFNKSLMVGDSLTDIQMGKKAGMKTVYLVNDGSNPENADLVVNNLSELEETLKNS